MKELDVAIIGGGLAGLSAACTLYAKEKDVAIFESQNYLGGKVRSDYFKGFILDRGFQLFFNASTECEKIFNYPLLELKAFEPAVMVRYEGNFHPFSKPHLHPMQFIKALFKKSLPFKDLYRLLTLRKSLLKASVEELLENNRESAKDIIESLNLSSELTERILKPFFRGMLLDESLECPGNLVRFILKMMIEGEVSLPSKGMKSLIDSLKGKLPEVHLNTLVTAIKPGKLILGSGEEVATKKILIACDPWSAAQLLGAPQPPPGKSVACCYFTSPKSPTERGILVLNADEEGPINQMAVVSDIAPQYAPPGESLIAVTVLEKNITKYKDKLESAILEQLRSWYGQDVEDWRHLHTYKIRNAYPTSYGKGRPGYKVREGVYVCGDYLEAPCMHSALREGRLAAEAILEGLGVWGVGIIPKKIQNLAFMPGLN